LRERERVMKVTCTNKEITGYSKDLEIEHEGKTYNATLFYHSETGYDLEFRDDNGKLIDLPEWADLFDNAERSLDYTLDNASGNWEYCPAIPSEKEVAV
jgi:hypothetical protein